MEKIFGMGNALVDILAVLPDNSMLEKMHLPEGSMQLVDQDKYLYIKNIIEGMKTKTATGGSAGNVTKALASLGASPVFIGKVGNDDLGNFFLKDSRKHGVLPDFLQGEEPTGVALTFISPSGERTFATFLGAAATMKPENLTLDMFEGCVYLFIEGYLVQDHDLILRAMQLAKEAGAQICLDLASYNIVEADLEFFQQLVNKYVDIVFANREEAFAFTGKQAKEAVDEISSMCSIAVVKDGSNGSYIKKGTEMIFQEAPEIKKVVDTTGAGDYYAAGFLYGLTSGYSMEKCGKIATLLATTIIQKVGTTLTKKKWEEIKTNIDEILQA